MKQIRIHSKYIIFGILLVLCFLLYWLNIGNYTFLDNDETKFVTIAKEMLNNSDWINVKLNGESTLDYPPLLFWLINLFCFIFGKINSEIVRAPVSLLTTSGIILLFFLLKNLLSKSYAFIITLIFATSLGTLVFSRLATNDMLFCIFSMSAVLCASKNLFSQKKKQKIIIWALVYLFIALAAMTCGILGLIIPSVCIIAMYMFSGNIKELFIPKHIIPGIIVFGIITLPWHIIMLYKHGLIFIKDYLSVCNFLKYTGIKNSLQVISLFLLGFLPWSFSFLWIIGTRAKDIINSILGYFKDNSQIKLQDKWQKLKIADRFISINTILFFTALLFAVLYGSKYTYTVLFLLFPASNITGFYWYEYIVKKEHDKSIFFATIIPDLILIICSLAGLFGHNILNTMITQSLNHLILPLVIIFFIIPVFGIFSVILKGRIAAFCSNLILMISISFILTPAFFNFMMQNGGQNDLMNFASIAKNDKTSLSAYISSRKYSIEYYYEGEINYHPNNNVEWLETYLKDNPEDYVIVEIKDLWEIEEKKIPYMLLDSGQRYCLIQHLPSELEYLRDENEAEVIVY